VCPSDKQSKGKPKTEEKLIHITVRDNKEFELCVDPENYVRVEKRKEYRQVFRLNDGIISLTDGRQLYVTNSGWVSAEPKGAHTNTEDARRRFSFDNGVLTIQDGRQLYICGADSATGWMGAGKEGTGYNNDKCRRTFNMEDVKIDQSEGINIDYANINFVGLDNKPLNPEELRKLVWKEREAQEELERKEFPKFIDPTIKNMRWTSSTCSGGSSGNDEKYSSLTVELLKNGKFTYSGIKGFRSEFAYDEEWSIGDKSGSWYKKDGDNIDDCTIKIVPNDNAPYPIRFTLKNGVLSV